ncbi:MAG: hypothetical protein R2854_31130 [Caldilineaceae bacterium]
MTISQIVELPNPLSESPMLKVPVSAVTVIPVSATAPMGMGFKMMPTMVPTKIANKCQASMATPSGGGINQMTAPIATANKSGRNLTPCHSRFGIREVEGEGNAEDDIVVSFWLIGWTTVHDRRLC